MTKFKLPENILFKIPKHEMGVTCDSETCRSFSTVDDAVVFFDVIYNRILDVNHWNTFAGQYKASFTLTNSVGEKKLEEKAKCGDFIKIKLPEIHHLLLDDADWVKIECLEFESYANYRLLHLCLKPSPNPCNRKKRTNHFFSSSSSNTIILYQTEHIVQLSVHGRNEFPNVFTPNKLMKLRNFVIANLGYLGLSKFQWQGFTNGMMRN